MIDGHSFYVFNIVILTFQLFLDLAHGCHVPTTVKNKELKKIITTKIDALQVKMTTTKNENEVKQMNQERALLLKELESVDVISTLQNEIVQKQSDWRSTKELSQKNQIEQEIMELKKKLDILINNGTTEKDIQTQEMKKEKKQKKRKEKEEKKKKKELERKNKLEKKKKLRGEEVEFQIDLSQPLAMAITQMLSGDHSHYPAVITGIKPGGQAETSGVKVCNLLLFGIFVETLFSSTASP